MRGRDRLHVDAVGTSDPRDAGVAGLVVWLVARGLHKGAWWGAHETVTFSHHAPLDTGEGPKSTPVQGKSWRRPIRLFFCDPYWHGDDGMHGTQADCHPKPPA
jgi:hypothetical protein